MTGWSWEMIGRFFWGCLENWRIVDYVSIDDWNALSDSTVWYLWLVVDWDWIAFFHKFEDRERFSLEFWLERIGELLIIATEWSELLVLLCFGCIIKFALIRGGGFHIISLTLILFVAFSLDFPIRTGRLSSMNCRLETVFGLEFNYKTFVPHVNVSVLKPKLCWVTDELIADGVLKVVMGLSLESLLVY